MTTPTPPNFMQALCRGIIGRCPHCGEGKMFRKFLKVAEACPHCGEELNHHRADDMPAYIVILLLGHILVPAVVWVEFNYSPAYWVHLVAWLPVSFLLAVGMLQPVKGGVVGLQWFMGLHGFHAAKTRRLAAMAANSGTTLP